MIRKYLTFLLASAFLLTACSDETFDPVLSLGNAPQLTAPADGSKYVLEEANAANQFASFTWTAADFGFQAAITYTLEIDKAGNNFANAITLGVTNTLGFETVTVEKVNSIMLAKEIPGGVATEMEVRVKAKVSNDVDELISPAILLTVTAYEAVVDYPKLQVPGNYQGWDPANTSTVIYSLKSDEKYEGYIYFTEAATMYKFTKGLSWDTNWGDDGGDGTLEPNGADIPAASGIGMYRLNVDLNALTHAALRTDWGLIGSATPGGWDSDMDMTYDEATGYLTITTDLVAGEIKFRANDQWDVNFGDDGPNNILEQDGANIVIAEPGNYTIDLILNEARYTYKIKKN